MRGREASLESMVLKLQWAPESHGKAEMVGAWTQRLHLCQAQVVLKLLAWAHMVGTPSVSSETGESEVSLPV